MMVMGVVAATRWFSGVCELIPRVVAGTISMYGQVTDSAVD